MSLPSVRLAPPSTVACVVSAIWSTATEPASESFCCEPPQPPTAAADTSCVGLSACTPSVARPPTLPPSMCAVVWSALIATVTAMPMPALPPAYSAPPPVPMLVLS